MPAKIRSEDQVIVISGKDKGKTGKVLRIDPGKNRVYVEGLNIIKRHQRPKPIRNANRMGGQSIIPGGIIEAPAPLQISTVMVICPNPKHKQRQG